MKRTPTLVPLQTSGAKKKRVETEPVPKVIIRLTPGIDEQFRSVMRYRGDLSTMVLEAINTTDLETAPLVDLDAEKERLRGTTVNLPPAVHKKMKLIAKKRNVSMNVLFNTAIAHWLAAKNLVKFVE
jgi:hypothetical protein